MPPKRSRAGVVAPGMLRLTRSDDSHSKELVECAFEMLASEVDEETRRQYERRARVIQEAEGGLGFDEFVVP